MNTIIANLLNNIPSFPFTFQDLFDKSKVESNHLVIYLAATTIDCPCPTKVKAWGTPHSSSLSLIWKRNRKMQEKKKKTTLKKAKNLGQQGPKIDRVGEQEGKERE